MGDQIGLKEAGLILSPVGEGSYGNLFLQKGSWFGRTDTMTLVFLTLGLQDTINGCGADGDQFIPGFSINGYIPMPLQGRNDFFEEGSESFRLVIKFAARQASLIIS